MERKGGKELKTIDLKKQADADLSKQWADASGAMRRPYRDPADPSAELHLRPWRVGRKVGRTIYDANDVLIGLVDTPELARFIVNSVNGGHQETDTVELPKRVYETVRELARAVAAARGKKGRDHTRKREFGPLLDDLDSRWFAHVEDEP